MDNLAVQLSKRYQSIGATADFEEAIQIARQVIELSAPDDPRRAIFLRNLARLLHYRYQRVRRLADLNDSIRHSRQSLKVPAISRLQQTLSLDHLSLCLEARFNKDGLLTDAEEAAQVTREALAILPENDPDRLLCLGRLTILLFAQFDISQTPEALEEAMFFGYEALAKLPSGLQDRIPILTRLAKTHHNKYQAVGNLSDLETAIKLYQESKDLIKPNSPESATVHHFLGLVYLDRFKTTNSMTDLDAAMRTASFAVYGTPDGHSEKSNRLLGLGNVYHGKHSRTRRLEDLETATRLYQTAADNASQGDSIPARYLNVLGEAHLDRYRVRAPGSDLELAIRLAQEAVDLTPLDHPDRALRLETLGTAYKVRSLDSTGDPADLMLTTQLFQEALDTTPPKHPRRASRLHVLGLHHLDIKASSRTNADLETVTGLFQEALAETSSAMCTRLLAGKDLTSLLARQLHWHQAYETAHRVIHLMPSLTPMFLGPADKKFLLSNFDSFASDAAAIALKAGKSAFEALQLLELGRGVLAGSLSDLYSDISVLSQRYPEVSARYIKVRDEVDRRAKSTQMPREIAWPAVWQPVKLFNTKESEAERSYKAEGDLKNMIDEIRGLPGFQDFLLPPSESAIKAAAMQGPLIVINISEYRCDAILITHQDIRLLALPTLHKRDLETKIKSNNLGNLTTLSWLWGTITNPVLSALYYTTQPPPTGWPRVWWIPTGPLSKFPLHASGIHTTPLASVLDLVASSYAPTVKAILHNRALRNTARPPAHGKAVLLAMETTPGQTALPYAKREVARLHALCHAAGLSPVEPLPLKEAVMSELMSPCSVFHFAGHGRTNEDNALESYLCLGETARFGSWDESLKIGDLWNLNLREGRVPFLAYLSACGTGVSAEERSVQEGVHLVGALQAVGFKHVVGTLWEVSDEVCADVAVAMYEGMAEAGWSDEAVCWGLHEAVRGARAQWLKKKVVKLKGGDGGGSEAGCDGLRKVILCDSEDEATGVEEELHWVPYVHFGA